MPLFELDPGAVSQTETMLQETGEAVRTQAGIARDSITGLGAGGWSGGASMVANSKQNDGFANAVAKLHNEINGISEALGLGRQTTTNVDLESEEALQAVPVELGNFGRMV